MTKVLGIFLLFFVPFAVLGQLELGSVHSKVNFREGPALNSNIISSIDSSNLLVILPRDEINGFIEVFDIESSSHGFVYKKLLHITDTLENQKQKFFEKSDANSSGDIELIFINKTISQLFVWVNGISYKLSPYEKKSIVLDEVDIKYFCSAPGLFPVFGIENLVKGNTYRFDVSL
jgi:hypothetical protein